ncbi:MAG: glycosyl hydrolase family 65 protein [Candidatus Omnitrophica bacterium]|nr:glycosyl hydrolase family 65 protein [Candidatus Omnitrophota bacterium]MDD5487809.1 glycosyl hydrolase family 65 protein [Candidatus Omnitrophota bacterium]
MFRKSDKEDKRSAWGLTYGNYKPAKEGLREALCTLANGYFGTRGAASETPASRINYPATYIAGVYNKLATKIAGRKVLNEDMVNCPNWLCLSFKFGDGPWLTPVGCKILSYEQGLDMKKGVLSRHMRLKDKNGRIAAISEERIVSMSSPHIGAIRYTLVSENYEGPVTLRTALDGDVRNSGVERYGQLRNTHLEALSAGTYGVNGIYLLVRTSQSRVVIAEASRTRIFLAGREEHVNGKTLLRQKKYIGREFSVNVKRGQPCIAEKTVAIYTSRDRGVSDPLKAAMHDIKKTGRFGSLLEEHAEKMQRLWKEFDIEIDGDIFSQKALRLHVFHLMQTASDNNYRLDIDAGLPARGLHGEAYRGHVFWDEMYVLHLYDLRLPDISKALLTYRYRRLEEARRAARREGYRGAMLPWQSGSTGGEETQTLHLNPLSGKWGPDHSHCQRHVSFAVAYNFWKHWERTRDMDFLEGYGAETIIAIAQFGASLAKFSKDDGRYHTSGLMGPDEFHEKMPGARKTGFRDNAYTNVLIVWTLMRGLEVMGMISDAKREEIMRKLRITRKDAARWDDITRKMNVVIDERGIIAQFDGYFSLKELDLEAYRAKYDNIKRMDRILKAEGKSPDKYKLAKQADVLMLFYIFEPAEIKNIFARLGYRFDRTMLKDNYDHYVKRTSHGSTLSKVVHCYISHILGRKKEAWEWYQSVLESDIYDTQGGTTPEGIHAGVMGGSVYITVKGFAGVHFMRDRIMIDPKLPRKWSRVRMNLRYRDSRIGITIRPRYVELSILGGKRTELTVFVNGKEHIISKGAVCRIRS